MAFSGDGKARIIVLKALVFVLGILYALRLFNLQIIRGEEFEAKANRYAIQSVKIPAARGEIYDRTNTVPFVTNDEAFSVEIVPAELPADRRGQVFEKLAKILDLKLTEIQRKIPVSYYHLYQRIAISSSASYLAITQIAEHKEDFPGVYWNSRPIRRYIDIGSLSHVIGYVGEIGRDEYKLLYNKGYASDDVIGKTGLEKFYDGTLKGQDGFLRKTVDVKGKDLAGETDSLEAPVPGKKLVLTIDAAIQKTAEKALGDRMGSVIVLKPNTGEILAMVSYPWYDPSIFISSDSGEEYLKLLNDPNKPLLNRAIQSSYPPASTFKTVLSTAILEEKALSPSTTITCRGSIEYGGRTWNCWVHSPGHGPVDLQEALAQSCDIYYWTAGRDNLGVEKIISYAGDYGYGKLTGIDLPGENAGFIPTPRWKEESYRERWNPGDTMNISIGQGYLLATPIQVANMIAMVVNDGVAYKPHLIKEIRDGETGALIQSTQPELLIDSAISASTFKTLREDLRSVISEGSARVPVSTKAVLVAGKTGTAEIGLKDRWHSWFAAFGPYGAKPEEQVVVVTMVEASNPWEWWAPYASNLIFQSIFAGQDADSAARAIGLALDGQHLRGRAE
jgi:penicillin-binding protein 2